METNVCVDKLGLFLANKISGYTKYKMTSLYKKLHLQFQSKESEPLIIYYIHVLKTCLSVLSD